jgi:lipoprotein-releasing system permease protein
LRYELTIALRYLRARRKDAFISVTTLFTAVGVMIGVAALIVMLAVMSGFEANLRQRLLSLSPQVQVQSFTGAIADYGSVQARIGGVAGVAGSDPFIVGQGMISSARGISGVVVRGVEPDNPVVLSELGRYVAPAAIKEIAAGFTPAEDAPPNGAAAGKSSRARSGGPPGAAAAGPAQPPAAGGDATEASRPGTVGGLLVGSALAAKLKVRAGDPVRLVAPIISGSNGELSTRSGEFRVAGVFESGVQFIDSEVIFMGLGAAQNFFGRPQRADGIEVKLRNLDATLEVTAELRRTLGRDFRVTNWMEYDQAASAGFAMLKRVYALVLLLLIGVAAFNLVATLIMVVMEKRRDIAVLVAMGATPTEVRRIFQLKGLVVGGAGTAAGLVVGAATCFALARYQFIHIPARIYGISTLPIDAQPLSFVAVALASLVLCFVATIYPARQAARETPVEVFRS